MLNLKHDNYVDILWRSEPKLLHKQMAHTTQWSPNAIYALDYFSLKNNASYIKIWFIN